MTVSAAQADAFYREALEHGTVWSVRDESGFPAPETPEGRAMPFWSLQSRAQQVVESVPVYDGFEVVPIPLTDWRSRWLPGLERDGVRAGLNWSGSAATGYDVPPQDVERNLSAREGSG
ncbi:DUF2750 domain-containing protein [Nocardioides taihuensis]|uniref:DUF2750 domain-containing protein n=1 Tax=Nocardioides taihuensis TaxID=1835606 RepID=A0ABW0BLF5_9ACTN